MCDIVRSVWTREPSSQTRRQGRWVFAFYFILALKPFFSRPFILIYSFAISRATLVWAHVPFPLFTTKVQAASRTKYAPASRGFRGCPFSAPPKSNTGNTRTISSRSEKLGPHMTRPRQCEKHTNAQGTQKHPNARCVEGQFFPRIISRLQHFRTVSAFVIFPGSAGFYNETPGWSRRPSALRGPAADPGAPSTGRAALPLPQADRCGPLLGGRPTDL